MNEMDLIWNRAACERGGVDPSPGDAALSSLLLAHGLTMNGGVLHAVESLTTKELEKAKAGYRFYELHDVADLMTHANNAFQEGKDLESLEPLFDYEYSTHIPDDEFLSDRFEQHYRKCASDFSPL